MAETMDLARMADAYPDVWHTLVTLAVADLRAQAASSKAATSLAAQIVAVEAARRVQDQSNVTRPRSSRYEA